MRLWITSLLLGLVSAPALCAEGDVSLAGQVILRIRYPAAGYSVAQRADAVQTRLTNILSMDSVRPEDVAVVQLNRETAVVVRDHLVITADWPTARFNKTTPEALAAAWASNLRRVLPIAMPRRTQNRGFPEFTGYAASREAMWQAGCANGDIVSLCRTIFSQRLLTTPVCCASIRLKPGKRLGRYLQSYRDQSNIPILPGVTRSHSQDPRGLWQPRSWVENRKDAPVRGSA